MLAEREFIRNNRTKIIEMVEDNLNQARKLQPKIHFELNEEMIALREGREGPTEEELEKIKKQVKEPRASNIVTVEGKDVEFPPQCQRLIDQIIEVNEGAP
jgi:hypothetical protein